MPLFRVRTAAVALLGGISLSACSTYGDPYGHYGTAAVGYGSGYYSPYGYYGSRYYGGYYSPYYGGYYGSPYYGYGLGVGLFGTFGGHGSYGHSYYGGGHSLGGHYSGGHLGGHHGH